MGHQVDPEAVIGRLAARIGQLSAENAMLEVAAAELQQLLDKFKADTGETDEPGADTGEAVRPPSITTTKNP